MPNFLAFVYRLTTGALFGVQLFFVLSATRIIFSREVQALPLSEPRRALAPDLVGRMLAMVDLLTMVGCALAVLCAVLLGRAAQRSALFPLLVGLGAAASALLITPAIHAMRAAGQTASPQFGRLHALSSGLLLLETILLLIAIWGAPTAEKQIL